MAKVLIDSFECSGCATCVALCPEVFRMDVFGEKAELIDPEPPVTDAVRQAAAFCPEKCIQITEP